MKKLAILGPGVVGGSCAEILLRDADLLERNAGEQLELSYVLARRALPDRPYKDKVVTDFSVIERDANVFLVIETIGGHTQALRRRQARRNGQQAAHRRARRGAAGACEGEWREPSV